MRDIIDIDSTYEDFEASDNEDELKVDKKTENKKEKVEKDHGIKKEEDNSNSEEDEFNVSLAKMERNKTKNN